jgi:hypothetical protein
MRRLVSGISVLSVALWLAAPAAAQVESKHRGFWISFGLGGGWNVSQNVGVAQETKPGGAGFIRLGGTPTQKLLLGGEAIAWGTEVDGATIGRGNGTVTVMFYPSVETGVFLKGGVGGSTFTTSVTSGNTTTTTTDNGFGATAGIGWDVRLGRNFYLTPTVDLLYQRVTDVSNAIVLITVGATWH